MGVVLNDILTLVGRLDDATGADTPRDRFRRFLVELNDLPALASLIDQAQRSLGEQHHRALQDAVVRLGRFLGFETTFGLYGRVAGLAKYDGQWRARHRLDIILDIRTNQVTSGSVEELSRAVAALAAIRPDSRHVPALGLVVVTPMYASRARLEDAILAEKPHASSLRLASVRTLLWLAEMVQNGRLSHDEVVQLFIADVKPDFAVDLLARFAAEPSPDQAAAPESAADPEPPAPPVPVRVGPAYWIAAVGSDEAATPEQFIESVVRGRQVLGLGEAAATLDARADDWLCFSVGRNEIVGRARVASIAASTGLLRGSQRFRAVFLLKDVEIYDAPIAIRRDELVAQLAGSAPVADSGPCLMSVSRDEFAELTGWALLDESDSDTTDVRVLH